MGLLDDIVAAKARDITRLRAAPCPARRPAPSRPDPLERLRRSAGAPLRLLAEIKRRSPSAGALSGTLSVVERARAYEAGGVAGVSVLTDAEFFGGSFDDLAAVTAAITAPTLCKDFVLDEVQLDHAAAAGAAMALLIVRLLDDAALARLVMAAQARGLTPLVEVTDELELERALSAGARLVGVNARDLDTLVMDLARASRVVAEVPREVVAVHLSGLSTPEQVRSVAAGRADAALAGEALMRADDARALLASFVEACG